MRVEDHKVQNQGSDEWRSYRASRITATDIGIILGVNPWTDAKTLWRRKMGLEPEQEVNEHMRRGSELEEEARYLFCKEQCEMFVPEVHVSREYPWAMASLDGINLDGDQILEIKCPKTHHEEVPLYYLTQVNWQMMCSGAEKCHFVSYCDGTLCKWELSRDEILIKKMIEKAIEFKDSMDNFDEPEEKIPETQDEAKLERLRRYKELYNEKVLIDQELDRLKAIIIEDANGKPFKGAGVKVTYIERKGAIDYSAIPQLKEIRLDDFRKPKTGYWRIG